MSINLLAIILVSHLYNTNLVLPDIFYVSGKLLATFFNPFPPFHFLSVFIKLYQNFINVLLFKFFQSIFCNFAVTELL